MHSCELMVPPPVQGAALLLELGTLIIEGRSSKVKSENVCANLQSDTSKAQTDAYASHETSRGAQPKRPAPSSTNLAHLSPAKRNRDQQCEDGDQTEVVDNIGVSASEFKEGLSVYALKARVAGGTLLKGHADALWKDHKPLCIEVLLAPNCGFCREPLMLIERWILSVYSRRSLDQNNFITSQWLLNAVRSQLHFSQISAWKSKITMDILESQAKAKRDLSPSERQRKLSRETCNFKKYESNCDEDVLEHKPENQTPKELNIVYNLKIPEEQFKPAAFLYQPMKHKFPITDIGNNIYLEVQLESLPRIEEVPILQCKCSTAAAIIKRRKSKDILEQSPTDDSLAKKLTSCSLTENKGDDDGNCRVKRNTYSPDLDVINSDMGCSSGISRKFSIYSSPNMSEFGFQSISSRGSTPDRCEFDSGFCTKDLKPDESKDASDSYHAYVLNTQVPSDNFSDSYLLLDDRMQTPCRQSGKHRCNCDDDSDKIDDSFKLPRRSKKDCRQSRDECKGPTTSQKSDLNRKIRTCSDNSDGRTSPELVHYRSVCKSCYCQIQDQNKKAPENNSTTSIPILQASKFDHVNRFGNFRSTVYKHGPLTTREFYSLKQQASYNQSGSACNQEYCSNLETKSQLCNYIPDTQRKSGSDDYRPSAKKLISSYTQTDDIQCKCGKSLIPMCFECSDLFNSESSEAKLKRSEANHNLAAFDESSPLSETVGRTSEQENNSADSNRHDSDKNPDRLSISRDKKVIDFNCDNSVSIKYECDKNNSYNDSFNYVSCKKDSLSHSTPLYSHSDSYDSIKSANSDLSIFNESCMNDRHKSAVKKLSFDGSPEIRKPKLKRIASSLGKTEKIVIDRNRRRMNETVRIPFDEDEDILYKDEESGISYMITRRAFDKRQETYYQICRDKAKPAENGNDIIVYDRGDYGIFGQGDGRFRNSDRDNALNGQTRNSNNPDHVSVPSVSEMDKFRLRLDSAASMVFHSRNGLPLTSSPAPLRRGMSRFDYDSSINSVSGIKSALYGPSAPDLDDKEQNPSWSPGSSPGSPCHMQTDMPIFNYNIPKPAPCQLSINRHSKFRHGTSSGLLGSFEESVLNGRLEPAATVAGFMAEIGASGEFCPPHLKLPVTVFFYSLGDNTTSAPYLGHINLGRKGYAVPRAGTIQVTLFNPHGTVVKMFVVMYDLGDMPPHSRTFLRQRTLWGGTCLRYLIHLRFLTSKSGKVYLHTDIRIIVSRKSDLDTAVAHSMALGTRDPDREKKKGCRVETGTFERRVRKSIVNDKKLNRSVGSYELSNFCNVDALNLTRTPPPTSGGLSSVLTKELSYELRSFTYGPENPKYSPR